MKNGVKAVRVIRNIIILVHFAVTFFTDHIVFEALEGQGVLRDILALSAESRVHYIACKLLLLGLIAWIWRVLFILLFPDTAGGDGNRSGAELRRIAFYSFLYFIPIIGVLIFKLPEGFLSNDETLIFAEASALNSYTWFYYLTTYYYIVTMMLIPCWLGPVLVKVALQVITCGYCVYRFRRLTGDRRGFIMYIPFFLFPVLAYTTSAHRIPVYYLIYILFVVKLLTDRLENVPSPGVFPFFMLLFASALITQWRTEGIYMAPLSILLFAVCYPHLVMKRSAQAPPGHTLYERLRSLIKSISVKQAALLILSCLLMQYAVQVPQNGLIPTSMDDKAENRMGPFWAYTITNMYRNGLDLEANAEDMEKVYRYLDRDVLRSINEDLGDINYEDTLILYYPGYTGVIEGGDYEAYVEGCRNIFKNNPDVFLRTRWGAFKYAALPYEIGTDQGGVKGLVKLAFSVFKSLSYNLFIPCTLMMIFLMFCAVRKMAVEFLVFAGLLAHTFIVFILAPASYFKYYLPVYAIVYLLTAAFLIRSIPAKNGNPAEPASRNAPTG